MDADFNAGSAPERRAAAGPGRVKVGTVVGGRFQIKQFLGSGGFGERYRAVDSKTERPIDIRILHAGMIDGQGVERLREEIQAASALQHKNIAATYGMGMDGDLSYIATEFVDGHTLRELVDQKNQQQKTFSLKGAYNVVAHIANGLAYAHQTMFHGALSPSNVLVNKAGRVKMTEFGIARTLPAFTQFQAQLAAGDFYCMAPELTQAPESADRRTDIYSVGVILFELLTGRAPTDTFEMPSAVRPDLPKGLDQVFERCCRPSPDERFLSAEELKQALFLAVESTQLPQGPPAKGAVLAPRAVTQENVLDGASEPNLAMVAGGSQPRMAAARQASGPQPVVRQPSGPSMPAAASPLNFAPPPGAAPAPHPHVAGPPSLTPTMQPPVPQVNVPAYSGPPIDESLEIWLIQKGKLDFGPFTMAEVKRQIMKGEILGEHVIVDSDSGKRHHVKNHPYLARFVAEAEMRREEQKRLDADRQAKHKGRFRLWMFFIVLAFTGGAGAGVYFLYYEPQLKHKRDLEVKEQEAKAQAMIAQANDADLEKILKGLSFEFPKPTIKKRTRGKGGKLGGFSGGEDFDAPTMIGDVTQEGGEEQLSPEQIQSVMNSRGKQLAICIAEERRRNPGMHEVELEFIVHGNGQVTAVRVNGQKGTPIASCMFERMRRISFPKYNGPKTIAGFSFKVN